MRTINFPNGLTLTSTALSPQDIEQLFQIATIQMVGIQPGTIAQGTTTQDSPVVTVDTPGAIAAGQTVIGVGIPEGTTVISLSGNDVTMSAPASATQTSTVAVGADEGAYYFVRVGWQVEGQPAFTVNEDVVTITAVAVDDPYNRIRDVTRAPNDDVSVMETTFYTRVWEMRFSIYGPNALDNARLVKSCLVLQWVHDLFAASNLFLVPDNAEPMRAPERYQGEWWDRADFRARFNEGVSETISQQTVATAEIVLETAGPPSGYGEQGYGQGSYGGDNTTVVNISVP